jgi:hypothetical protein
MQTKRTRRQRCNWDKRFAFFNFTATGYVAVDDFLKRSGL